MPTPQAEIWLQFTIIAVCVLVIGLFMAAMFVALKYILAWQVKQAELQRQSRVEEANAQRDWQECMSAARDAEQAKRDEMWREYFATLQNQQASTLSKLIEAVEDLQKVVHQHSLTLNQHDVRSEQFISETRSTLVSLATSKGRGIR